MEITPELKVFLSQVNFSIEPQDISEVYDDNDEKKPPTYTVKMAMRLFEDGATEIELVNKRVKESTKLLTRTAIVLGKGATEDEAYNNALNKGAKLLTVGLKEK